MLISHIVSVIYSGFILGLFLKNVYKLTAITEEAKSKRNIDFIKAIQEEDQHMASASLYFCFTGIITAIAFYLIDYLPKWITGGLAADFISTGAHVTIILMVISLILKPFKLATEEKKKLLFLVALTTSIAFIVWDWKLGLTALCIVAGKHIWMDILFDFRITKIKEYYHELKSGHSIEAIIGRYCFLYLLVFMIYQLAGWINHLLGRPDNDMIVYYIAPFVLVGSVFIVIRSLIKKTYRATNTNTK